MVKSDSDIVTLGTPDRSDTEELSGVLSAVFRNVPYVVELTIDWCLIADDRKFPRLPQALSLGHELQQRCLPEDHELDIVVVLVREYVGDLARSDHLLKLHREGTSIFGEMSCVLEVEQADAKPGGYELLDLLCGRSLRLTGFAPVSSVDDVQILSLLWGQSESIRHGIGFALEASARRSRGSDERCQVL
ncbi:hypothetical protein [Nesterenkonia pannonica]|uniref:hypothetical protein n=1 Tax=Nesterenkonia pannonica TaxID=1548602 RepID=UPI002164CE75|nr:hypothetical protein [Nesterenkonia pannonica]